MGTPIRQLLCMMIAFAAMVLLAPAAASAHESHHAPVHAAANDRALSVHLNRAITSLRPEVAFAQTGQIDGGEEGSHCTSGCCFGMGCCVGTILSGVPALDPPDGPPLLVTHRAAARDSARLTTILEPPNALA